MPRLDGKIALVTGGSRGIGAAIAEAFVREGARVIIASRKEAELAAEVARLEAVRPGAAVARVCHTGTAQQIVDLVAWCEREVGVVDVAVNNAATNPYFGPLMGTEWAAWDKTFDVNVKGYFEVTRQVARRLIEHQRPGAIVNVASVAGLRAAPMQGVYAMTKAAVVSMTQTFAAELGAAGIRVNAIAPGLVDTKFASALVSNPDIARFFTDRALLKRHAQPSEIAGIAVFLASDEASYVTGQVIPVDGGFLAA